MTMTINQGHRLGESYSLHNHSVVKWHEADQAVMVDIISEMTERGPVCMTNMDL